MESLNDTQQTDNIFENLETGDFPLRDAVKDSSQKWPASDSDEEKSFKDRKGPSFYKSVSRGKSNELAASMIRERKSSVFDKEREMFNKYMLDLLK